MLPLFLIGIAFLFLVCGAIAFLACLPIPTTRRRALSAALWFASCGPCSIALMLLAGLGVLMTAFAPQPHGNMAHYVPKLISALGWGYLVVGALLTIVIATALAWLHQVILDRLPFKLFRIYATIVVAGIGSVFGWCLGLSEVSSRISGALGFIAWIVAMGVLILSFGFAAFKWAGGLRTPRPLFADAAETGKAMV